MYQSDLSFVIQNPSIYLWFKLMGTLNFITVEKYEIKKEQ